MPRPAPSSRSAAEPREGSGSVSPIWFAVVGLLLTARYLQPTEAAVLGETLWQAQLWLVAAAAWCWVAVRSGRAAFRWSPLDGLLWLLVLGHALSTVPVFLEGGDRRGALNITWEWAGLAAALFVVRQVLGGDNSGRGSSVFAAVMVAMAALGVWQHHVSLPETVARYDALRAEEAVLGAAGSGPAEADRLGEVRRELAEFGAPDDAGGRRRWEDRVRYSREPFGTFALANTLGGLLAAALPLLVAAAAARSKPAVRGGLFAAMVLVLYCLILTKSRTAWVGLAAGGCTAAGLYFVRGRLSRRAVAAGAAGLGGVVLIGLVVLATGGLDEAVFSGAPKSLRFRLDYWQGALGVLSERPLLGTGAGNFRAYYLEHRPEGASEAVAAPHNLLLDAWAAGGLLSLVALVGLLAYAGFRFLSASGAATGPAAEGESDSGAEGVRTGNSWSGFEGGACAAFPVVTLVGFVAGQGIDWRLLVIAPAAAAALLLLNRSNGRGGFVVASGAGLCALVVHLLGADGIEFPTVIQTLLLLALPADRVRESRPTVGRYAIGGAFAVLTTGCFLSGVRPVLNAGALTGRAMAMLGRGEPGAERVLAEASAADRLANGPPVLMAELATAKYFASRSGRDYEAAVGRWREVLAALPRDIQARRRLAELLLAGPGTSERGRDASAAAALLAEAVRLSPTEAALHAELSRALETAGSLEEAREAAGAALRLDEVNLAAGHADLVFGEEVRAQLERLAVVGNERPLP